MHNEHQRPAAEILDEPEASAAAEFQDLIDELVWLRHEMADAWNRINSTLPDLSEDNLRTAENFVHYLALRRSDLRGIQLSLANWGISSLGRSESHVMWNLTKVLTLLHRLVGKGLPPVLARDDIFSLEDGNRILLKRSEALLGHAPRHRDVRIMITLPTEAADDYLLVRDLVAGGMNCARINCAHDSRSVWERMVEHVKRARIETGRPCSICVDIAGPKLRTGPFAPGRRVLKLRPKRDSLGFVLLPARLWIAGGATDHLVPGNAKAHLRFPQGFFDLLQTGAEVRFTDARGSRRALIVKEAAESGFWAEVGDTSYIVPDTEFVYDDPQSGRKVHSMAENIPPLQLNAVLKEGDTLVVTADGTPGTPETRRSDGSLARPARVPCTLPDIFHQVKVGESIWFDDGKIGGVIDGVGDGELTVRVTHAGPAGQKLKADKGINLPDTDLRIGALTEKDIADLEFVVEHADMVGYSFVKTAADVRELQAKLKGLGRPDLGIVIKIETRLGFDNLPEIILAALESPVAGVMIARGDLAVEAGFERLAEIQEEILWMCEAAHMPVIWATQVLEQLTKKGRYSRAEITDAAMAERAECVMLNKGPFIVETVRVLDSILMRMEAHQSKKRSLMRPLKVAERFFDRMSNDAPLRRSSTDDLIQNQAF